MYSELFQCECTTKTLGTFIQEFMFVMGKIIPPETAEKYVYKPMNVITSSLNDIYAKLLDCYTLEEMRDTFLSLTDNEQHFFISSLWVFETEFSSIPEDALVCVPLEPKHYIKPYLNNLLSPEAILV